MVNLAGKWSFCHEDCCRVEVVKGGRGFRLICFCSTFSTAYSAPARFFSIAFASFSFGISNFPRFLLFFFASSASKETPAFLNRAAIVQYSWATNFCISFSRSETRRTATDCTLPADNLLATFFQRKGESLYPTSRSRILRA